MAIAITKGQPDKYYTRLALNFNLGSGGGYSNIGSGTPVAGLGFHLQMDGVDIIAPSSIPIFGASPGTSTISGDFIVNINNWYTS